ncbi:MAG TPA: hypothetical protein VN493_07355 [Thermoanaerobaculia bacterium]|nr:hypothetical protein [Thermoanaerobaculia bacterium]
MSYSRKTRAFLLGIILADGAAASAEAACGEASCVPAQGAYVSHFTGAGCTGTESYYLPYDGYAYQCRSWDGAGECGTIRRTVTNRSYRYNGTCYDAWPSGNTLSEFVTVYRGATSAPTLTGYTSCAWGSPDCNACVNGVQSALSSLRDHGDILGFHMSGAADVDWIGGNHWEGVQRLPTAGARYLAVSRAGAGLAFVVVEMGSRTSSGRRFRSNRLSPNAFFHNTAPPASDRIVWQQPNAPGFDHGGGMQAVGRVLAVPVENGTSSRVLFFDMANPASPVPLYTLDHSNVPQPSNPGNAGAVGVTRLADGRYLLVIAGNESASLDFYVSTTTSLLNPATQFTRFSTQASGFQGDYQNVNLVTQCDGRIFLVGTHNDTDIPSAGNDWACLHEVRNGAGNTVSLTSLGCKHLYCGYPTGSVGSVRHCNLDASGGIYIDSAKNLVLYGVEHDNDGPSGSVKLEEFRASRPSSCPTIQDAWVELYDDSGFKDRGLMIDYVDRLLENYDNYDQTEGFEDKTSAAKWCVPPGWRYRLYQHKNPCGGSFRDLTGAGEEDNFDDIGFGDEVSCSRWLQF